MSEPPPENLKQWSKNNLVREVQRLRAILHEHSEQRGGDPLQTSSPGPAVIDVAGDPHARGGALFDARNAVLMDSVDVMLVDTKSEGAPVAMMMALAGRINYRRERAENVYLFEADGAAAIISQITGLAQRAGGSWAAAFVAALERRMNELP